MAHRILITKPDTTTLYLQVENAKVKKTLNKEDYVQFNSTSESFIDVPIGSTIDIKNANATLGYETYKLNKRGKQTKINSTQFKYLFKFENPIFDLKKSTFRVNSSTDTALLATAEGFIDQIILSAAADGYTFTKGSIDTTELKNLEFTGENCLAVLNRICDEFDLEYRCLSNVISLEYRISTARPGVTLSQGFDNGIIDISEDETSIKDLVTRLYYEGSTKNLPSTYGFKRLQGTTPYVSNNETTFGVFTKVKYYDEIFPEFTGTVGATTYNDDGTLTFIDTSIGFNINDQLIPNVKALVNMTSGSASGYAFEILRYDDDNQEITLIPYHSEQGVIIPESGGIEISSSDTYKLTDLILPQSYIDAAIVRLDAAAAADVSDSSELPTIFTLKTDAKIVNDYYEAGEDVFELGDQLGITDSDLTIPSDQRIIEIEYDLFYKAGNCKFKISGTRFALPGRKEEMENYKSAKLAEKTKPYDPLNLQLSSKKPYSVYSQVFDVDDAKFRPENIRTKSVDPFMNAVDNGDTQYSLQGVNFTANAAGVNSDLGVSAGTLTHHSINALTRPEIDKIIADGGTYDPSRTWTIAADTLTAASTSTGYNIYLKVPTEATETAATVELSETHIWPKEDFTEVEEYVYYKVGYLNPVDGDYRSVNLLFGGNDIGDGVSETDDTNGFPPSERTGTTISFVDGTRTFTIAPTGSDFYYYDAGIKYTKTTAQSIVITDVSGLHVFYFEGDTLTTIANPSDSQIDSAIRNTALVAYVYWDAVAGQSNYIGDERHGTSMSPSEHAYLHFIFGARFLSGGALNTMQVDGSTSDNASAQFGVDSCMIADEDITTRTSLVLSTDGLPIFYKLGTEADFIWKRVEQAGYPLYVTGSVSGLPYYNQLTGGNWQLTETNSTDYTLVHVIVTNDNFKIPFVVMGEFEYASKGEARAGALVEKNSLTLNGLPTAEFIFIASVIYAHKSSYSNAVKSIVISTDLGDDYIDWRYSQEGSSGGTGGVTSSWIGLTDTPSNYATNQFKLNKVNTLETALEFTQMTEDTSGNVVIVGSVDAQSYKLNSSDLYVSHLATLATGIAYSNGTTVAWTDLATLETDPVWTAEKVNYYTSIQVDSLLGGYVTAATPFAVDNTILKSDGTGRGAQTSIMTDDGSTVSVGGNLSAEGGTFSGSGSFGDSVVINKATSGIPLRVSTYNDNTGWDLSSLSHSYYPAVLSSEDAVLGLVSENEGGHGSGIDLMEVTSGVLQDKWWIGRLSSGSGSNLQLTYGNNSDYTLNRRIFDLTPNYEVILPNVSDSKLMIRHSTDNGDFGLDINANMHIYAGKVIQSTTANPNTITMYNGSNARMLFNTTYASSSLGGYYFTVNGADAFQITGNNRINAYGNVTTTGNLSAASATLTGNASFADGTAGQHGVTYNQLTDASFDLAVNSVSIDGVGVTPSNYVPYTLANQAVDLNGQDLSGVGNLTATSLIKSGGTSSQFLKADGSIDSSTYLTTETDPVVGAINGLVKSDGAGNISAAVSGTDYFPAISGVSGDVLYHNGTSWTALNKGTDDQVLTLASGLPSWADAASGSLWLDGTNGLDSNSKNVGINTVATTTEALRISGTVLASTSGTSIETIGVYNTGSSSTCFYASNIGSAGKGFSMNLTATNSVGVSVTGNGAGIAVSMNSLSGQLVSITDTQSDFTGDHLYIKGAVTPTTSFYYVRINNGNNTNMFNIDHTGLMYARGGASFSNNGATSNYITCGSDADLDVNGNWDANSYLVNGTTAIDSSGYIKPVTSTDAAAPNSSIYYSSDASKLVFKDSSGTVNNLY